MKYLHTKVGHEVDFALVRDQKIEQMIEVKQADHSINPSLRYFHEKYKLPAVQVVKDLKREKTENEIEIMQGNQFFKNLYL